MTSYSDRTRTHAASLLPIHAHSPALLALVAVQVDTEILRQYSTLSSVLLSSRPTRLFTHLILAFHSHLFHTNHKPQPQTTNHK